MIDLWLDLLLAALIVLANYGIGRVIRRLVPLSFWCHAAELAYSLGFGLGAVTTLLFGLSLIGWLVPAAGWALLVVGVGLAIWQMRDLRVDLQAGWRLVRRVFSASLFVKAAALIALAFVVMNIVADLAPPVEGDTVHSYLLTSRYWVEAGRYVQPPHIWASTLPGNMMMLSAWALLLNRSFSLATLVTGFSMSLFLALAVYALARQYFGRGVSALAAVVIYTMPDAGYLAQSAKVDMGWAFFEALTLAAVFRWLDLTRKDADQAERHPEKWLVLGGVCLGLAAGSKNQTLISIGLLGLWIVLHQGLRRDWRGLIRAVLFFGLATLIAALPYYLYNAIAHGNPFYPVFADQFVRWFGAQPSPRSELGTEIFYPWTVWGYLANAWGMFLGHGAGFYLGFIAGPIFLLAIPAGFILGLLQRERIVWRVLGYSFVFSVIWFLVKQAARHFLPGLILLSVVTGLALWRIDRLPGWGKRIILGMAVLVLGWNLINGLGVLYWNGAYRVALGLETRQEYLRRYHDEVILPTFPDWEMITMLNNQLGPSDRILANHATSPLYIEPDIVSGNWGDRVAYDAIADPDTLVESLLSHHIGYILIYTDPSARQTLYTQPEFLAVYTELVYEGPRARLYRILRAERR
jgi:4-amino-4-deoxy-L-arabinose transferase-like glycosyltransferase